jgi:uncharacterized protein (UPF0332 family)
MISANELLELAAKIAVVSAIGGEEARCRAAVSRSYYAAFHWAREFLVQFGISVSSGPAGHGETIRYLSQSGLPNAQVVSRGLAELRRMRNLADYELHDVSFESCAVAIVWIDNAWDVNRQLDEWLRDRPAIQAAFDRLKSLPQFRK